MQTNILDRIASETDLTKSERKLASVILKNPALVINENIAQLAKRAGVSEPSVFRFCKRFGAEGFPAFKLVLSSLVSSQNLKKVDGVKQGDSVEDVIYKVVGSAKVTVSSTERMIDKTTVARAIDVISQSRRLIILSQGLSSFIAVDFVQRMMNLGFSCESYNDRNSMLLSVSSMRSGDVLIAVSASGKNPDVLEASKLAKQYGASVVAIVPSESAFSEFSDLILATTESGSGSDDSFFNNRLSLLLLSQVIVGGVMLRRGIAISDLKPKLNSARSMIYKDSVLKQEKEQDLQEDDGSIKPDSPITTLDWHY